MKRLKSFIEHLQTLDEEARRVWVYILSGIAMGFVIILWMAYLNATIVSVPPALVQEEKTAETLTERHSSQLNSPLANFEHNVSVIFNNLKARILGITDKSNEIIIEK